MHEFIQNPKLIKCANVIKSGGDVQIKKKGIDDGGEFSQYA